MNVHKYNLKFTEPYLYAASMVANMLSKMSLFVSGLSTLSRKEGKASILVMYIDIVSLMMHVQQVEEEKLRDGKIFHNKKAKTTYNESYNKFW